MGTLTVEPGTLAAIAVAVSATVIIVATLTEAAWLYMTTGEGHANALRTAAAMGSVALLVGAVLRTVERSLWRPLGTFVPDDLGSFWDAHPVLAAVAAFVAWDAASYLYHRVGHSSALGWASHQVHHSGPRYDLSLSWRQSWLPLPAIVVFAPLALSGIGLETFVVCAAVSNAWQALAHTALPLRFPGWFTCAVVTPQTHRVHHDLGGAINLGAVLTVWDRLWGTWMPAGAVTPTTPRTIAVVGHERAMRIEAAGWAELWRARCARSSATGTGISRAGRSPARRSTRV